jgi:hypothetical protein
MFYLEHLTAFCRVAWVSCCRVRESAQLSQLGSTQPWPLSGKRSGSFKSKSLLLYYIHRSCWTFHFEWHSERCKKCYEIVCGQLPVSEKISENFMPDGTFPLVANDVRTSCTVNSQDADSETSWMASLQPTFDALRLSPLDISQGISLSYKAKKFGRIWGKINKCSHQ